MQWYYSKNGTQLGPVEQSELLAKLMSGEVTAGDLVWRDGMTDWVPSGQVSELRSLLAAAGSPPNPYVGQVAPPSPYADVNIPNYLWQSIVVTILCCWPFGIPAIIYAAKVDGLKSRGDIAGARAASASAKTWCWVAFGSSFVLILLYALAMVLFGLSGAHMR